MVKSSRHAPRAVRCLDYAASLSNNRLYPQRNRRTARGPCLLRSGFTLLEVILALSLTVVVLALIGLSMKVQTGVAKKSGVQVDEAKPRQLVEQIAGDIRNAMPFKASQASSDGSTSSSSSGSTTTSGSDSSGSTSTSSSDSTALPATTPLSGGIFGTATAVQMESFHRPKVNATLVSTLEDSDEPTKLSDVRSITYSSGQPITGDMSQDPESPEGAGLYKRDIERAEFVFGSQNGFAGGDSDTTKLLAPEVTKVEFSYYDGSQFNETWDSNQQGKLPTAIRVSVSIHLPNKTAGGSTAAAEANAEPTVYDTLIQLPNSNVGPGPVATDGVPPISKITLDQPSQGRGGGREGGRGGPGNGRRNHDPRNHKPPVDPTKPPVKPIDPKPPVKPTKPIKPTPTKPGGVGK